MNSLESINNMLIESLQQSIPRLLRRQKMNFINWVDVLVLVGSIMSKIVMLPKLQRDIKKCLLKRQGDSVKRHYV
jgi:hypothetical protein